MRRMRTRALAVGATLALSASLLAACGSDADDNGSTPTDQNNSQSTDEGSSDTGATDEGSTTDTESTDEGSTTDDTSSDEGSSETAGDQIDLSGDTKKEITIPIASGWAEDDAVTNLWKYVLEKHGYTVDAPELDIGPIFESVASGDSDVFFDTWLPITHKKYWEKYGDDVDDINVWYDNAALTITVPSYMDIDSLDDLASIGDKVDKTITGIDPGAGLTDTTENAMMPDYGLTDDGWSLQTSSTAAMLAALGSAIDDEKPIVVTLWHPHWAYSEWDLKDLKDPKGSMGKAEEIHVIGSQSLADENPGLHEALSNFTMDDDTLASLENTVLQENKDDHAAGAKEWADAHPDFVESMLSAS